MSIADDETSAVFSSIEKPAFVEPPLVLVIGRSRVNSIVVSRIAERIGLRCLSFQPQQAASAISIHEPAVVILDGGTDNRDCDNVLTVLRTTRPVSGTGTPAVVLLSTRNMPNVDAMDATVIDAVVAKPILPEMLQPVLHDLVERGNR